MANDALMHYGTKEHSGRYPWGSGENPYQRLGNGSIRARVKELKDAGMSEKEIADSLGISTGVLRQRITLEKNEADNQIFYRVRELKEKGYSNVAIGNELNISEGTVRNYLKSDRKERITQLRTISDALEKELKTKKYLDVGEGANLTLNCTEEKLKAAVTLLQDQGYEYHTIRVDQLGTTHKTTISVLCPPGTEKKDLYNHLDDIHEIDESRVIKTDGTVSLSMEKPRSVKRDRIMVRYGDQGGSAKDGVIELRRGVDDISLGQASYAQVRIAVDDKMYMKGMAIYNDNMPPGVDIIYNSNKPSGSPDTKVFKSLDLSADNPFGATIKGLNDKGKPVEERELKLTQRYYKDKDGKEHLSAINIVNEQGTWGEWSKSLSSQFLSKQSIPLAKRQLDLAYKQQASGLDDILRLTEPTVKRKLLEEFADNCDAAASELKAASLPRQRTHVILPVTTLKDNEVYAPNYRNGEHVVLIRYPHGGTFEIPELVVNNNHKEGKSVVGNSPDAIGINIKTAEKLSGADFDGDTVVVIPSDNVKIKTSKTLKGLEGFDPKSYKLPDDMRINPKTGKEEYVYPTIKNKTKQTEMGKTTNLIADMTLKGADADEIARAVRHSMVIIDSEKHRLDYKQSAKDNNIAELKEIYQGGKNKGASTIISRASAEARVNERREYTKIDPATGKKIYTETGRQYESLKRVVDEDTGKVSYIPTGKMVTAQSKTTKMAATDDAFTLTSDKHGGYPMETVYALHANKLKALANKARKEMLSVEDRPYSPTAAATYAKEVESLEAKLLIAQKNAPRERQAQLVANSRIKAEIAANPGLKEDKDRLKKLKGQALTTARVRCGAKSEKIHFTDKEWEAIQSGAIKKTKLKQIIGKADKDEVKERSMPKNRMTLSASKIATIKAMSRSGFTQDEIAQALGVSTSSVNKALYN